MNAGGEATFAIEMVEADVQPEGDGRSIVCQSDKIAQAHGAFVVVTAEGAGKAW